MNRAIDEIVIRSQFEAQRLASEIGRRVKFKFWRRCSIKFIDEKRGDRLADTTVYPKQLKVRMFQGGQTVGTLLHEMAHNSIFCLWALIKLHGEWVLDHIEGEDDAHGIHHEIMIEILEKIYEEIKI